MRGVQKTNRGGLVHGIIAALVSLVCMLVYIWTVSAFQLWLLVVMGAAAGAVALAGLSLYQRAQGDFARMTREPGPGTSLRPKRGRTASCGTRSRGAFQGQF